MLTLYPTPTERIRAELASLGTVPLGTIANLHYDLYSFPLGMCGGVYSTLGRY